MLEKIKKVYSNYQAVYVDGKKVLDGARTDARNQFIDWKTMPENKMTALDLGCSNGMLALEAARQGIEVTAVERAGHLNTAKIIAEQEGLKNIKFIQIDIESPEFKHWCPRYDVVFFMAMLSHMKDRKGMLQFIDRHTNWCLWYETNFQQKPEIHLDMLKAYTSFFSISNPRLSEIYPNSYYLIKCVRQTKMYELLHKYGDNVIWVPVEEIWVGQAGTTEIEKEYLNKPPMLMESIKINGLVMPLLIRPYGLNNCKWAIVEGGHRLHVLKALNYRYAPCFIKNSCLNMLLSLLPALTTFLV